MQQYVFPMPLNKGVTHFPPNHLFDSFQGQILARSRKRHCLYFSSSYITSMATLFTQARDWGVALFFNLSLLVIFVFLWKMLLLIRLGLSPFSAHLCGRKRLFVNSLPALGSKIFIIVPNIEFPQQ
jgi:hypothetical protein